MGRDDSSSFRGIFAVREFTFLWLAHVLSVAGDQIAKVAITVVVYDRTASAGLAAATYAISYVPDLVGGSVLAGLADRYSRRAVMVAADLARAALVAVMGVPGVPLWSQVVLLVGVQVLAAPFGAARQAALPDVLNGDQLVKGLGILSGTYQIALVAGFGAGGGVIAGLGTGGALWADAATFAVSAALIRFGLGRHEPATDAPARAGNRRTPVLAGWVRVARNPRLRSLLAIACCAGFYVVPEGIAVPYAAQLGVGAAGVGWLLAANPLGTVLGVLVIGRLPAAARLRLLGPLAVGSSLVLLPTGSVPGLIVTVLLWMISGACSAHDMITQAEYVGSVSRDERALVVGVAIAALRVAQGAGIVLAGLVAQILAPSLVIAGAAALGTVGAAAAATAWARANRSAAASGHDGTTMFGGGAAPTPSPGASPQPPD
ncbi:MFS transporter [Amycolatopsis pigmentata]|uniref:MFS transporter n=1 Tax=Amycolatopsis pigmentata TaxID=450801 RepID=A0ABW5FP00_9PSEU